MKTVHRELSTKQTLDRTGYDSVEEVMRKYQNGSIYGIPACCTCGSRVEEDGQCPGGNPSIILKMKLV